MLTQEVPFKGLLGVQVAWLVVVEGEVNIHRLLVMWRSSIVSSKNKMHEHVHVRFVGTAISVIY